MTMPSCNIQQACTRHSVVLPPSVAAMLLTQTRSCKLVLMPVILAIQIAQQGISMRLKDMLAGLTFPYVVVQSVYKRDQNLQAFLLSVS